MTKTEEIVAAILNILEKDYDISDLENLGMLAVKELAARIDVLDVENRSPGSKTGA
jgi:hypothetical protein